MADRVKVTEAQRKVLVQASVHADGAIVRGSARHRCAENLERAGLARLLIGGNGLLSRACITPAGRALLAKEKGE